MCDICTSTVGLAWVALVWRNHIWSWLKSLLFLALLSVSLSADGKRVTASQRDNSVLFCHVPPNAENTWLNMGVWQYFSHGVELKGSNAPTMHSIPIPRLDCEGEPFAVGFCEVFWGAKGFDSASVNIPCLGGTK